MPERRLENGWFIQSFTDSGQDYYRYEIGGISSFAGNFFVEWRAVTDNPDWLLDKFQTPVVVSAAGQGQFYYVVMTASRAALTRFDLTRVFVPISSGEPHTYRVEVYDDEYVWYVDGTVADRGVPVAPYPDPNAFILWGSDLIHDNAPPATTAWDYIRFGEIPQDASGNFDSDRQVDRGDYRFVHECLTNDGPGLFGGPDKNAGPGCRFTDFDFDGDVDLFDFAEFANHYTGFLP